uniref:Zinc finger protein 395b n=1 Tax=Nothobranchius pienaari TaxID=704102 RepID=A0A1A8MLW1_9TELE
MGPEDGALASPGGTAPCPPGPQDRVSTTSQDSIQQALRLNSQSSHHRSKMFAWGNLVAPTQPAGAAVYLNSVSAGAEAADSFKSPESVEMDEIMAAMVLTSLSCSPVVQSPPQTDPGPGSSSSVDMEGGGGELSDSGSSGYWSWDHGNVSPAPSPSVTEVDSSPDEGLHLEPDQGEELTAKKPKSSLRCVYKCLWPSCGKVLTSSVGIKRHIRVTHLGSGSDQSQREEDFYYTKICCEAGAAPGPGPAQASNPNLSWASCGSPSGSELQIPMAHRPRSNSSSGPGPSRPSSLSQSAPSSFWQIHSEHLYQERPQRGQEVSQGVRRGAQRPVVHSLPLEEGLPALPRLEEEARERTDEKTFIKRTNGSKSGPGSLPENQLLHVFIIFVYIFS